MVYFEGDLFTVRIIEEPGNDIAVIDRCRFIGTQGRTLVQNMSSFIGYDLTVQDQLIVPEILEK